MGPRYRDPQEVLEDRHNGRLQNNQPTRIHAITFEAGSLHSHSLASDIQHTSAAFVVVAMVSSHEAPSADITVPQSYINVTS